MTVDSMIHYGTIGLKYFSSIIDLFVLLIIYLKFRPRLLFMDIPAGYKRMYVPLIFAYKITELLKMNGTATAIIVFIAVSPLIYMVAYPIEFQRMLDDYNGRNVNVNNFNKLLSENSRREVAQAIVNNSKMSARTAIIIIRQDELKDILKYNMQNGDDTDALYDYDDLGQLEVTHEMLETLTNPQSPYSKGAIVIQDNYIIAANVRMPIVQNAEVARKGGGNLHFGMLGVVMHSDAVVVGVSANAGSITVGGSYQTKGKADRQKSFDFMIDLKDYNVVSGITKFTIYNRVTELLRGAAVNSNLRDTADYDVDRAKADELERRHEMTPDEIKAERNALKDQRMSERKTKRRNQRK